MLINSPNISGSLTVTGNSVITGSLTVLGSITGAITGSATTASYVEYTNVANKPTLVSGSSQVTYSGLTGIPSGIVSGSSQVSFNGITDKPTLVSGSSQITYSGLSSIPSGIVSGSAQISGFGIFATTGSNQFNGSQAITGSLTVTGQVVAQTLNVQQVTSSIVYSSGSNVFGNSLSDTQQFTGSVGVTGSLIVAGAGTFSNTLTLNGSNNVIRSGNELRFNRADNAIYTRLYDAGSLAANGFILDNTNGEGFHFQNNGTTIMRMNSSGNVGIGTTSPSTLLHVSGSSASIGRIVSTFALSSGFSDVVQILNPNQTGGGLSFNIGKAESTRNLGKIVYAHSSDGSTSNRLAFGFYDADNLLNLTAGGNVGIGTTSPSSILQANFSNATTYSSGVTGNGLTLYNTSTTNNQYVGLYFLGEPASGNAGQATIYGITTGTGAMDLAFSTRGSSVLAERMRITSGGNIEIGTTGFSSPSGADRFIGVYGAQDSSLILQDAVQLWELYVNDDFYINRGSTNVLTALRSNGNVGIGTTSPGANLHVVRAGDGGSGTPGVILSTANGANDIVRFQDGTTTVAVVKNDGSIGIGTGSPADKLEIKSGYLRMFDPTSNINGGYAIQWSSNNGGTNVSYAHIDAITTSAGNRTGDLIFRTSNAGAPTEKVRILSSGGITFNGDTAAVNALDDYEEGSWTPALQNATVSYSERSGSYVKIGNHVFVRWGFRISSISGKSGTVTISGLPFTSANLGSYQEPSVSVSTGVLATADFAQRARVFVGNASTSLFGRIINNGDTPWETGELQNGSWIIGEIFYYV